MSEPVHYQRPHNTDPSVDAYCQKCEATPCRLTPVHESYQSWTDERTPAANGLLGPIIREEPAFTGHNVTLGGSPNRTREEQVTYNQSVADMTTTDAPTATTGFQPSAASCACHAEQRLELRELKVAVLTIHADGHIEWRGEQSEAALAFWRCVELAAPQFIAEMAKRIKD